MAKSRLAKIEIPYIGSGAYCYANSTAMLLYTIGESVPPSRIEVLSGVGLGASLSKKTKLIFFSWALPDTGISKALDILGFSYKERKVPKIDSVPYEELKKDLMESPVVIGPLDMGYLNYDPDCKDHQGFDHFVLMSSMDDKEVKLHDPAGFPCVSLDLGQLELAWKSEKIGYGKDFYRYWTSPKRIESPTEEEVYNRAMKYFKSLYRESEKEAPCGNWIIGREAILFCANRVQEGKASLDEIDQLIHFVLPLGARRALDFAFFFDCCDPDLAILKWRQAELFGKCHTIAVAKDWLFLAKNLRKLADVEEEFRTQLLDKE